ncbi:MAG TPA: CheR family methyltransferase [Alphaproteobacteria bacterium]|nr:CheR family methyltransferase [Alphaproteobacteria bacterium]
MFMNRIRIPKEWGEGIRVRHAPLSNGGFIIDDLDQVFSGNGFNDITCFFRYAELFNAVAGAFENAAPGSKLLVLPSSIGPEAYSMASIFNARGLYAEGRSAPVIEAFDISDKKTNIARLGVYPPGFGFRIPPKCHADFQVAGGFLRVRDHIRKHVNFLPPASILDHPDLGAEHSYRVVMCLNLLCYLKRDEDKISALRFLASQSNYMICLNYGGPPERRKFAPMVHAELAQQGFRPHPVFGGLGILKADIFFRDI